MTGKCDYHPGRHLRPRSADGVGGSYVNTKLYAVGEKYNTTANKATEGTITPRGMYIELIVKQDHVDLQQCCIIVQHFKM